MSSTTSHTRAISLPATDNGRMKSKHPALKLSRPPFLTLKYFYFTLFSCVYPSGCLFLHLCLPLFNFVTLCSHISALRSLKNLQKRRQNQSYPYKFSWGLPKIHIFHDCLVWPLVTWLLLLSSNWNIVRLPNFVMPAAIKKNWQMCWVCNPSQVP